MKRVSILAILLVAALSAAVTYGMMRGRVSNNVSAEAAPEEKAPEKPELKGLVVQPVSMGESWDVVAATGKVGPNINKVVKVGPRIAGRIATVSANVGDVVSRGQVLATLSSIELAQARSAYKQAASRVKAAEQSYNQQTKLAKMGGFNTRPLEEARSEQSTAQGELAQAKGEVAQYKSELVRAESELAQCTARFSRAKDLYKDQIVSKQDYEAAEAEFKRDSADVETARTKIRQAEAKVQQAQDRTKVAKGYLDREQKIYGSDILSARELQTARAAVTSAKLEMESAADTIRVLGASPVGSGDTISIVSPISGRIVERNVNIGEMAEPSGTLFTIMNLSDVWVEANVYEKDLTKIHKGQSAEIRVNTFADKAFTGTVTYIGDVLDSASRTAKIRCAVSNPNGALKPEMFATINIVTAKRGDAILIPKKSVLDDSGKKIAYIACMECPEDIKAGTNACGAYDRRELSLGSAHGDRVEVISGLNRGDKVVTDGAYQLKTALGSGKLEAGCTDH